MGCHGAEGQLSPCDLEEGCRLGEQPSLWGPHVEGRCPAPRCLGAWRRPPHHSPFSCFYARRGLPPPEARVTALHSSCVSYLFFR